MPTTIVTEYIFEIQLSIHPTNIRLSIETRSGIKIKA